MAISEQDRYSGLICKLRRDAGATPRQLRPIERCCELYIDEGLIHDDVALPLHIACDDCEECWAGVKEQARPPQGEAEISVPWIGPHYGTQKRRRVCVIGINQNTYGGLGAHWWITRGAIDDIREHRAGKRPFHRDVGRYLLALDAAASRPSFSDSSSDQPAATAWEWCAFIEAVKCAPKAERGKPKPSMWRNCPRRFLPAELRILAPAIVLAVGHDTWEAVKEAGPWEGTDYGDHFWRATQQIGDRRADIFFVNHPAYGGWRASLPELEASLGRAAPPRGD